MIELRMFSYNFITYNLFSGVELSMRSFFVIICLHDIERYTVLKESKQSFYSTKTPLIINLKKKSKGLLQFSFKMPDAPYLACSHLLIEIPRGFELRRIGQFNCDNRSQQC